MNPTEINWLLLVAYLNLEQQHPAKACTILRVLSRLEPDNPDIERCHALAELLAGNAAAAARIATRAMRKAQGGKGKIPMGLIFAKALWNQGKHEAASDYMAHVLTEIDSSKLQDQVNA